MKLVVDSPNADDKLEKIILLDPGAPADIVEKFNLDDLGVKNKFLFKEITIGYGHKMYINIICIIYVCVCLHLYKIKFIFN